MKKLRLFTLALSVIYLVLAPTLINKNTQGNKKMGLSLNPANWGIVDQLQGQEPGLLNFKGVSPVATAFNTLTAFGASPTGTSGDLTQVAGANSSNQTNQTNQTQQNQADPYAKNGGVESYNSMVNQLNTGKANALSGAGATMDAALRGGQSTILDYIQNAKQQQQGIDQKRANAQFSLQEGKGDIMDMVGRGIRSGGVMLANKNAGSSGAAGQIARAYGELGNRETRDVGNQYALENQGIDLEQNQLATGFDTQKRKIDEFKIGQAEEIAGTARNALAALEAQRVGASLPELFQIDQEVQAIKQQTLAKLGELDTLLASERSKINPMGQQDVFAKANEMRTAGTGGPQMFNFNTDAAQMQMNGPSVAGSQLPIYSNLALNRRREV